MSKIIHTMIRVMDEDASVNFYDKALGLKVRDRFPFDDFTLVYLRNDETEVEIELTINKGRSEPYALGNGYGHIAVTVADLEAEHARLTAAGIAPTKISDMAHQGVPLARFFFITDPDGYKIEVLHRNGRYL